MSTSTRDILLGAAAGLAAGAGLAYLLRKTYIIPHMPNPMHDATLCPYTPHMIYKHIDEGASAHTRIIFANIVLTLALRLSPRKQDQCVWVWPDLRMHSNSLTHPASSRDPRTTPTITSKMSMSPNAP